MAEVKMERSSLDADSLPNNSLIAKQKTKKTAKDLKKTSDTQKAIQPVVKATVQTPSFGKRFVDTLGLSDGCTVGDYLLWDVIVPAGKDLVSSIVTNGINLLLYGGAKPVKNSYSYRDAQGSRVSYGRYYEQQNQSQQKRGQTYNPRAAFDFSTVLYNTKADAQQVLDELLEIIDVYHFVSVSEFLQLSDVSESQITYVDRDLGWDHLGSMELIPVNHEGQLYWALNMPKPIRR